MYSLEKESYIVMHDDDEYVHETTYKVFKNGNKEVSFSHEYALHSEVEETPTQLDLIQQAVEKSNDELRQEGADALTLELIASGII